MMNALTDHGACTILWMVIGILLSFICTSTTDFEEPLLLLDHQVPPSVNLIHFAGRRLVTRFSRNDRLGDALADQHWICWNLALTGALLGRARDSLS